MKKVRKLYTSPNGTAGTSSAPAGGVFVRHEANVASGGHVAHIEIAAFLAGGQGPEQELLRLIGTLVEDQPVHT